MKFGSLDTVLRERLTDAPAGEWLDHVLEAINHNAEQTSLALQGALTNEDNTRSGYGVYRMTHATAITIANPLKVRPRGIKAIRTIAVPGSTRPRIAYLDWEFYDTPTDEKAPQQLRVTPYFDVVPLTGSGAVGERQASAVTQANAVALTSTVTKTVTSISLTAGAWDLVWEASFTGGAITGTVAQAHIATSADSVAGSVLGDSWLQTPWMPTAASDENIVVAGDRRTLTSTTTIYGNVTGAFTAGTLKAYGRLSAVRAAVATTTPSADVVLFFDGG